MRESWVKGGEGDGAGEGAGPAADDRARHLDRPEYIARRRLLAQYRQRASEAMRTRKISRGAYVFLDLLIEWARTDGNGDSTTISERTIQARTGWHRKTIRTYRRCLEAAGLIGIARRWARRRGWFWEAQTTLFFVPASGTLSAPDSGTLSAPDSGTLSAPSLNSGPDKRLNASREALPEGVGGHEASAIAPAGQSSGLEGATAPGGSHAGDPATPDEGRDTSRGTAFKAGKVGDPRRYRRLMQAVRETLGQEAAHDVGKWGERAKTDPDKVERVLADFTERRAGGLPVRKGVGAALEDTWTRFVSRRRNGHAGPPSAPGGASEAAGRADLPPVEAAALRGAEESEKQRRMWAELKAVLGGTI